MSDALAAAGSAGQTAFGGATPTPTPTPVNENTPTPSWISSITDAETLGALQTKGWDKLDPAAAVEQAVKAHRNAEKMLGAPADHLVRLPTRSDDEAGWRQVWQKLGAPEKPDGYDLSGIQFDDPDMTARFSQAVRETASEMSMPKAMVERMAQRFHKFVDDAGQAQQAESSAQIKIEQDKLVEEWGRPEDSRFKANMFIADKAAESLGVTPEDLAKLKDGLGAAGVARLFHRVGLKMGEDKYVTGSNPANSGVMSREQAVARRAELMADRSWAARYLAGGAAEKREMTALNTMLTGGM